MAPSFSYKAGKCYRRGNTNFVDADPAKGTLEFEVGDDELLHMYWKNRGMTSPVDDLIIFSGDAVFEGPVKDDNVYCLKFMSSDERHFFWFQSAVSETTPYSTLSRQINAIIADPTFSASSPLPELPAAAATESVPIVEEGDERTRMLARLRAGPMSAATSAIPGTPAQPIQQPTIPSAPNPTRVAAPTNSSGGLNQDMLAQLQRAMTGLTRPAVQESDVNLQDILSPTILTPLLASPELRQSLFPHLPTTLALSSPPTHDEVSTVISSAAFADAVTGLDRALRTGALGQLVRGLGLPESAGAGVEEFLSAIAQQAEREETGGGDMDTSS